MFSTGNYATLIARFPQNISQLHSNLNLVRQLVYVCVYVSSAQVSWMAAWLQNLLKLSSSVCVLDSVSSEECEETEETESNECEPIASILDAL